MSRAIQLGDSRYNQVISNFKRDGLTMRLLRETGGGRSQLESLSARGAIRKKLVRPLDTHPDVF